MAESAPRRKSTIALVGAPGVNTSAMPRRFSVLGVLGRDRAAHDDEDVIGVVRAETLYHDPRHQRHVYCPGENRDPHRVRVLLDRRLDDLLGRLVEAGVDDLHPRVAEKARDDLRSRSCPSSPGFAMTTRIVRSTALSIGTCDSTSSAPLPPGPTRAVPASGYVVESEGRRLLLDCRPGVLAASPGGRALAAVDAIAITHFHLDHWGDLVPWVWGSFYRRGHDDRRRSSGSTAAGGRSLEDLGSRIGFPDMFERTFVLAEYRPETTFSTAAGLDVHPCGCPAQARDVRLPGHERRRDARVHR